jgi:hypothetical protein
MYVDVIGRLKLANIARELAAETRKKGVVIGDTSLAICSNARSLVSRKFGIEMGAGQPCSGFKKAGLSS